MSLLITSTREDRQDIRRMLSALEPLDRLRFLCEYVATINKPGMMASARNMPIAEAYRCDRADARVTDAIYMDLIVMASDRQADLDAAVNRLAGYVSRPAALRENRSLDRPLAEALRVGRATRPRSPSPV